MINRRIARITAVLGLVGMLAPMQAMADVEVQWLGHATTRIVSEDGKVIVIDPFLTTNPKAPLEYRNLEAVGPVDLILVTHGHIDHIADLAPLAAMTGASVIGPYEMIRNLIALGHLDGGQVTLLGKGGYAEPLGPGLKVHMVPAEHTSSLDLGTQFLKGSIRESLRHITGGEAVGYVIEFPTGFTLYHTGDTGVFGDMRLIGEFFEPDLTLICIGGVFTMDPAGAAYALTELIKPTAAVPIHYGTYPAINRSPDELADAIGDGQVEVIIMQPGEMRSFP
jgi:L-ascorbate metabolism protein UlaG (beta-lactamase superfamily)